jgi:hypothetical protein
MKEETMTAPNGGANGRADSHSNGTDGRALGIASLETQNAQRFSAQQVKELVAELEIPFEPSVIEWRVTNTAQGQSRGQIVPYADPRAYTDRLNTIFSPAGWTRKYGVQTSANFERAKDQKLVAKVLVTCELTIFGLGSHSAMGEEFTDNENALTAAEAQAFKRACCCFGLGRYLYHFTGTWVDLDERKRPKAIPRIFGWATPQGWREGLRPNQEVHSTLSGTLSDPRRASLERNASAGDASALVSQIEAMAERVGKRMYRGLLKHIARVWNPRDIQDAALQQQVLAHMQAAERGVHRLDAAVGNVGPEALTQILRSLNLQSLDLVDNLQTLREIVLALERAAQEETKQ